jgi:3-deoxy-manno-octulosonate cytidylyltransferase (CMP-KDO synthetase)
MKPIVLIPARMAATRLPDKPLADIGGVAMIVRVLRQAEKANIGPVAVAAGDQEIVDAVRAAGGQAVLTDPALPSGSDRIQAALHALDPGGKHDAVINLQGDMPFVEPSVLSACAGLMAAHRSNPDVVKAILALEADGKSGRALYFTRSTLYGDGPVWRHIGIYGYRRAALERFNSAPPSALERREKLEQLRGLEMGLSYWASIAEAAPISVDNPADLEAARAHAKTV